MTSYNDWFNMSKPIVRKDINPSVEHTVVNKSYNDVAGIKYVHSSYYMPMGVNNSMQNISEIEIEPVPMVEGVDWKDAYPAAMLQPDVESDLWMHKDDVIDTSISYSSIVSVNEEILNLPNIEPKNITGAVEETIQEPKLSENVEESVTESVPEVSELVQEEKPIVKKKNTRRTKKK